jgi:TatD DNase family protein
MFDDIPTVINDARMGGVRAIITAGGSRSSSTSAARIADGISVFAVIGVDPESAQKDGDFIDEMGQLVDQNRNIIGIGEVGLDYKVGAQKELQKKVFERQIAVAQQLDVPIVVHSRGAIDDVIDIVKEHGVSRAMFHFFEGDEKQAEDMADMGNLISIPAQESGRRKRIIGNIRISSIAAETDSPVVGDSPIDVIKAVEWIAQVKGIDFAQCASAITENVKKLFGLWDYDEWMGP